MDDWKDKYPVGSKWIYDGLFGIREVIKHNKNNKVVCKYRTNDGSLVFSSYSEIESGMLKPYQEEEAEEEDWKDNYPVGSLWQGGEDIAMQVVAHIEKGKYTTDGIILVWLPRGLSDLAGRRCDHYNELDAKTLTPHEPVSGAFWLNICMDKNGGVYFQNITSFTKKDADRCAPSNRIACVPAPWTEGDGL